MGQMHRFIQDEAGATAIEYALVAAMMAITAIGGVLAFGTGMSTMFNTTTSTLNAAAGTG